MSKSLALHDGTGIIARDPVRGVLLAYGTAVPALNAVGFAPGCKYVKIDAASIGTIEFINVGTRAAANFVQASLNGTIAVPFAYNAPDDQPIFVADRAYTVVSIIGRVLVAGTGGAATVQIRRCASGTAVSGGTAVHSGSFNLVGTVDANQSLTVNSPSLPSGSSLGFDVTGTTTSARGVLTVLLIPA
jgi:hypothetical protein